MPRLTGTVGGSVGGVEGSLVSMSAEGLGMIGSLSVGGVNDLHV